MALPCARRRSISTLALPFAIAGIALTASATEAQPPLEPSAMRVEGSLTRDQVVSVISANARQMRLCYETALRSNDTLSGTVVVRFTVRPTGTVASSSLVRSTLGDRTVERCLVHFMLTLTFPLSTGTTRVSFPIVFAPPNSASPPTPPGRR